jgi:hypothetical protein
MVQLKVTIFLEPASLINYVLAAITDVSVVKA